MIIVDQKVRDHVVEDLRGILIEQFGDDVENFEIEFEKGPPFLVHVHLKNGKTARLSYELNAKTKERLK